MKSVNAAALLLVVAAASSVVAEDYEAKHPIRTHSLSQPYLDEQFRNRNWDWGGSTIISPTRYVRLTPDLQSRSGWIWSSLVFNYENFEIDFEFKLSSENSRLFGDGFVFWFTEERMQPGPVFGNKDQFKGLGVFFDTFSNGRHMYNFPYVYTMVGDGEKEYDHGNDGGADVLGGCEADFNSKSYPTRARIRYSRKQLEVLLDIRNNGVYQTCMSAANIVLPKTGYIGFTAATGDATNNHDIISVDARSLTYGMKEQLSAFTESVSYKGESIRYAMLSHKTTGGDSFLYSLFLYGLMASLLSLAGAGGYYVYMQRQAKASKRF